MTIFEIIGIVICAAWIISMPYLNSFKLYQYCMLMIMPFMISYLLYTSIIRNGFNVKSLSWMLLFFIGGLIYQAKRFYDSYLSEKDK
ncbi:MAG: hypothetical protein ACM3RX_05215 [Methanococcaceae archaeon]